MVPRFKDDDEKVILLEVVDVVTEIKALVELTIYETGPEEPLKVAT